MRIAPKPQKNSSMTLVELLSLEKSQAAKGIQLTLPDGRKVPNEDTFVLEEEAHFTIGEFEWGGWRFCFDVRKEVTNEPEKFSSNSHFYSANSVEWFMILLKGYEARRIPESKEIAKRFQSYIQKIWTGAGVFGVTSCIRLYQNRADEINHENHGWGPSGSWGTAVGETQGKLDPNNIQMRDLTNMLFGTREVGLVNEVWKHYAWGTPVVVQNKKTPFSKAKSKYSPWFYQDKIVNKLGKLESASYLSIRLIRY